jgi:hypothetical protein
MTRLAAGHEQAPGASRATPHSQGAKIGGGSFVPNPHTAQYMLCHEFMLHVW